MSRPTVAVIIPAHPSRARNGLLHQAVASVWGQFLLPDELIVEIDHDGTGAPPTRQRALNKVTTQWVAFLDSDDMFLPRHLELCLRHAIDEDADLVYPWFRILQQFADGTERTIGWDGIKGDGVFPPTHFTDEFDPTNPIETTITVLVRTELAKQVGFQALDRGQVNTGEDRYFTLGCLAAGAKIRHLRRFTWLWRHHWLSEKVMGNTSGLATKGDAAA